MAADLREHLQSTLGAGYALERELGGGMARVFVAADTALGRKVVVKVLPPELAGAASAERFKREVQLAAGLRHPHVVPLLAAGEAGGLLYYTMPFVEGESLADRLRRGPLPVGEAVRVLRDVADALAYAHERGLVHRDVKSSNILLERGHAAVTDFGVAKALQAATQGGRGGQAGGGERATLTTDGMVIGTPAYMAPEQALGDPATDHRADLYALGVVAYEVLTGAPPFTGPTPQALIAAHITEPPRPLAGRRPDVPPALAALVMRLLAKAPADRPQRADDVLRELEGLAPAAAGAARRRAPWRSSRRVAAAVALAAAGVAAGAWWLRDRQRGAAVAPAAKVLAVLPFTHLGPPDDQYFTDGLTEEVTSRLATLKGVGVISRTSANQYRRTTKPLKQVGRELGADYVLEGSVRWERTPEGGRRVRVTPQLVAVADDRHVWADRLDADVTDIFAVQGRIAERVADALDVALGGRERERLTAPATRNFEAYTAYLRAAPSVWGYDPATLSGAIRELGRIVALDSTFALAYAALSIAHRQLWASGSDLSAARLALAKAAADRALRLAPDLPEAHVALGRYFVAMHDYDRALAEFTTARDLQPGSVEAWGHIVWVQRKRGRWDEALRIALRTAELDPRNAGAAFELAGLYFWLHRYPEVVRYYERGVALGVGDDPGDKVFRANIAEWLGGDTARARALVHEAVARFGLARLVGLGRGGPDWGLYAGDTVLQAAAGRLALADVGGDSVSYYGTKLLAAYEQGAADRERVYADSLRAVLEPKVRAQPGIDFLHDALALAYAGLGRHADAVREQERAVELLPVEKDALAGTFRLVALAWIYARVGDEERAIDTYARVLAIPSPVAAPGLRVTPDRAIAALRRNPRFQRLLAAQP